VFDRKNNLWKWASTGATMDMNAKGWYRGRPGKQLIPLLEMPDCIHFSLNEFMFKNEYMTAALMIHPMKWYDNLCKYNYSYICED
jgi:hypothetical protein